MKKVLVIATVFILMTATSYANTVLFDGSLGTTLDQEGWYLNQTTNASPNSQTANAGGYTRYDTTGTNSNILYYSSFNWSTLETVHPAYDTLSFDRMQGFEYYMTIQVQSIATQSPYYSALLFSILSNDRYGMGFMFFENSISAYYWNGSTAVWRESSSLHNPTELTDYRISINNSEYALYVNDDVDPLISGDLIYFTYSGFATNSFHIGDGSPVGRGVVDIYEISTSIGGSTIPEPATIVLSIISGLSLFIKRKFK